MYRFLRVLLCLAAVAFAATGVIKILHADGRSWPIVHGAFRIAFAAFVFSGAVRSLVRGKPEAPTPAADPPPSADDPGP